MLKSFFKLEQEKLIKLFKKINKICAKKIMKFAQETLIKFVQNNQ